MEKDRVNGNRDSCESETSILCRLCHGSTDVTIHIGQNVDKSTSIVEKIHYCTSLIVKVGDDFPQKICITCAENLNLMYDFKSKAILCDLELSKNVHREDVNFTYIPVSDDPLNMTYKLDLKDQDPSADSVNSCVYNIIDGDELTIERVSNNKCETTITIEECDTTATDSISVNCDKTSDTISNKLNVNLTNHQDIKTNNKKENLITDHKRKSEKSKVIEQNKKIKNNTENEIEEKPILIVKNGKVIYICGTCNFETESMVTLHNHRSRIHSDTNNYKCSECPTFYKTLGLLKRHIKVHHNVTQICKDCDKRFSNKQGLDRHINNHHNVTPLEFQCVKCNAYFDTMDKMEDHFVVHYTNPSSSFSCNHCDRSFTTYAAKSKHIYLEHMIEIECDICHVVLPTKEAMDKHNNSVHQPKKDQKKMYACTTCGKYFSGLKDILNHRETHIKI